MLTVVRAVVRAANLFRPVRVESLESFIVFLKSLCCPDVAVTAEFLAKDDTDSADVFTCTICFSAVSPNGRSVIYSREFTWSKRIVGITLDLKNMETRTVLSWRLRSIADAEFTKIRKEVPDIRVGIVDLNGDRLVMTGDGHWSR